MWCDRTRNSAVWAYGEIFIGPNIITECYQQSAEITYRYLWLSQAGFSSTINVQWT